MRPRLPKIRTSYDGEHGRVVEFEADQRHGPVVHAVCDWDGCPLRGQRHGILPATDEPPHPVFQIIMDR